MAYSQKLRRDFKANARQDIHRRFWPTMGAVILGLIPEGLVTLIYRSADFENAAGLAAIAMLVYLAASVLILPPITMGLWMYNTALARVQDCPLSMVFQCFGDRTSYVNSIKIMLSIFVRSLGWVLLEIAAVIVLVLAGFWTSIGGGVPGVLLTIVLVLAIVAMSLMVSVKIRRYDGTYIRMIDNPTQSPWRVSGECAKTFRGHNWELMMFDLSFLLWWLGSVVTLGVVGIYTLAYTRTAFVHYFDALREYETGEWY